MLFLKTKKSKSAFPDENYLLVFYIAPHSACERRRGRSRLLQ